MPRPPTAVEIRDLNEERHQLLRHAVRVRAALGDTERTLRAGMMAANYAWIAPSGRLADLELERAVIGSVRGAGEVRVDGSRTGGHVLHVMSEAYSTGGHTRLVWRWIEQDRLVGDVALTNQRGAPPVALVDAVTGQGGAVHDLRAAAGDFLDRARRLRALMDHADLVVLHVHPFDTIALAAVNLPGTRPPVVYENHTDQSFWLGVGAADVLCNLRPEASVIAERIRGIPAGRVAVLPIPVAEYRAASGPDARSALGIPAGAPVALTVSADWKMRPCWGQGMADLVDRVLQWSPDLRLVVVGSGAGPDWARTLRRHQGRISFTGRVDDPAPYYAIADLYLDSYPLSSPTSALEAAVLGLPVVTLDDIPLDEPARIVQANTPAFAGVTSHPTIAKVAIAVKRLVDDPALRRLQGDQLRAAALDCHAGDGWLRQLDALYERARTATAADLDEVDELPPDIPYGLRMVQISTPAGSPASGQAVVPLCDQYDEVGQADAFAALNRDAGPSLGLRVAAGWEHELSWTGRLLGLAGAWPRLRVSMPFVAGDDPAGSRTEAVLLGVLGRLGTTAEDCGDVTIEVGAPDVTPSIAGELPFTDEALDWLEGLLDSPCWAPPPQAPVHEPAARSSVLV